MEQDRIQTDGLQFRMLELALDHLHIKRIVLAGFAELARPEEEHDELCVRLFGNTLQPEIGFRHEEDLADIRAILASRPKTQDIVVVERF